MKKRIFLSLLALTSTLPNFAGGCSAQAQIASNYPWCSNGTGRCAVFSAFGSGETTECHSYVWSAICNKYDAFGALIVSKYAWCYIL